MTTTIKEEIATLEDKLLKIHLKVKLARMTDEFKWLTEQKPTTTVITKPQKRYWWGGIK